MTVHSHEKGYPKVASPPDENGCNHPSSESEPLANNQQSDDHDSIKNDYQKARESPVVVNEESVLVKARDSPPDSEVCLLACLIAVINRYIACNQHQALAIALWCIFSWSIRAFKVAPILVVTGLTKGVGKTQLWKLVRYLSRNPIHASHITPAAMFRAIDSLVPTLFIDEYDTFINRNEDFRGIINAGFEAGEQIIRCATKGRDLEYYNVFCPKVLAGIGKLPETIQDRSIVINMRRKRKDESKDKLKHVEAAEFKKLSQRIQQWADTNMNALSVARPKMPPGLSDRKEDCWEPLFAIADLFEGDYPQLARKAALEISGTEYDEVHINEQLLLAIKAVFEQENATRLASNDLLKHLLGDQEAPWLSFNGGRPMTIWLLAKQLKLFGISSTTLRFGSKTLKGYQLTDFEQAFLDYLP